jgi:hypothetical protein
VSNRQSILSLIASVFVANVLAAIVSVIGTAPAEAGELSAIVNGKSWHAGATQDWNEDNYGLGVEYEFASQTRWKWKLMANGFVDSVDNMSYLAGGGLHRRLWDTGRFRELHIDVGFNAFLMTRKDVNDNRPFPGALPSLTLGNRVVGVNLTYLPRKAVEIMYDSDAVDQGISGIVFLQLKLNAGLFGF